MNYTEEEIIKLIIRSCDTLVKNDLYLFQVWRNWEWINERSLTHRLAVYLDILFPEWNIDCEYNKLWDDPKRIHIPCEYEENWSTDNLEWKTVYPDIIIHKRWWNWKENNLIVIEAKKDINNKWRDKDICKLNAYKNDLHYWYQYAFFIDFITWDKPHCKISIMDDTWDLEIK